MKTKTLIAGKNPHEYGSDLHRDYIVFVLQILECAKIAREINKLNF